jgi:hypothetical protein
MSLSALTIHIWSPQVPIKKGDPEYLWRVKGIRRKVWIGYLGEFEVKPWKVEDAMTRDPALLAKLNR